MPAWIMPDGRVVISPTRPLPAKKPLRARLAETLFDVRNAYREWRAVRAVQRFGRLRARVLFWRAFWRFLAEAFCAAVIAVAMIWMFLEGMIQR